MPFFGYEWHPAAYGADDAGISWLKIKTGIDGAIRRPLFYDATIRND